MQALTPEQSKIVWSVVEEIGKWALSGITLAVVHGVAKKIHDLPGKILEPFNERLDRHEEDDRAFQEEVRAKLGLRARAASGD